MIEDRRPALRPGDQVVLRPAEQHQYSMIRPAQRVDSIRYPLMINDERKGARAGHVYLVRGAENQEAPRCRRHDLHAGQDRNLHIGEIVHSGKPGKLPMSGCPSRCFSLAIEPKSRGDETKIAGRCRGWARKTGPLKRPTTAGPMRRSFPAIGDCICGSCYRDGQAGSSSGNDEGPEDPLRETISQYAEGHYRPKKQTAGPAVRARCT